MKKQKDNDLISEDDKVFILKGKDDELYLIDDPLLIAKLDAKVKELQGMDDAEVIKYLLPIVNPEKYQANEK